MKISSTIAMAMVMALSATAAPAQAQQYGSGWNGPADCGAYVSRRDRERCNSQRSPNAVGAAVGAGIIGLTLGAIIAGVANDRNRGQASDYDRWVDYCSSRYRSFDPRTGTFLGNDGRRHPCR